MSSINKQDVTEKIQLAKARKNTYLFLSRIFLSKPTEEIVKSVLDEVFLSNIPNSDNDDEVHPLRKFANSFNGDITELGAEFSSLFVIPMRSTFVKPYESVYLTGLMNHEPTNQVKCFYKQARCEVSKENVEFEDHVGIELEFMGILCEKEIQGWVKKNI